MNGTGSAETIAAGDQGPIRKYAVVIVAALTMLVRCTCPAQGTAFTYQGRLSFAGNSSSGNYDFTFSLYAAIANGVAVAGPLTNSAVAVNSGVFVTTIDFGPGVFTGSNYWLDIAVRSNGVGTFSELSPRQPITAVPYAIMSGNAGNSGVITQSIVSNSGAVTYPALNPNQFITKIVAMCPSPPA